MQITATIRSWTSGTEPQIETRVFSALASGLLLLTQWLVGLRVTGAVMEATGIYWEKVYDLLSEAGLDVKVVNAQHVKQLKGRKTDIADSIWLSRICQFDLASPSLILPKLFRDLRGLSRYRRTLIEQRAQKQLRIQKVLDRNGVRVGGVLTKITRGVNGRRILNGIAAGEERDAILAAMTRHVRKKFALLGDALSFEVDEHSRWILSDLLQQFDLDTDRIDTTSRRIEEALSPFETLVRLLETVPGVSRDSAMAILIELGPDMSVFPSARHCAAWAGLCPGNNESARQAPQRTHPARQSDPARGARRMRTRRCANQRLPVPQLSRSRQEPARLQARGRRNSAQDDPHHLRHAARRHALRRSRHRLRGDRDRSKGGTLVAEARALRVRRKAWQGGRHRNARPTRLTAPSPDTTTGTLRAVPGNPHHTAGHARRRRSALKSHPDRQLRWHAATGELRPALGGVSEKSLSGQAGERISNVRYRRYWTRRATPCQG